MYTRFELQERVGGIALNFEHDFFVATAVALAFAHLLGLVVMGFAPAKIHAVEFSCEQAGFVATGTSPDFHDYVLFVVRVFWCQQDE